MAEPLTEFLKLFEVRPEEAGRAIAELAGGGATTAAFDGILEGIFNSNPEFWTGKFPFLGMPIFKEQLPPLDDCIVAATGPVVTALGALTKNKDLFRVGLGQSLYGVPAWLKVLITRNVAIAARGSSPSESKSAVKPKGKYSVTG